MEETQDTEETQEIEKWFAINDTKVEYLMANHFLALVSPLYLVFPPSPLFRLSRVSPLFPLSLVSNH